MMSNEARPVVRQKPLPSSLYAILDPDQSQGRPALKILTDLLAGGAKLVQLRAKNMASNDFYRLAMEARELTRRAGCLLIVNDRVDIAMVSHADGVHLGQEDLPLAIARNLMESKKLIGVSTHNLTQALQAEQAGADYIGFGPIFGTFTKDTGYSALGLTMLREVRKAVEIPIVAIGGITEDNVKQVWDAGADAAAIISDILGADDVATKVRKILAVRRSL
jgi:thiamine-phosphate pyrophosphorylase